jgi:hypothetical protein
MNEHCHALVQARPNRITKGKFQRPVGLVMHRLHQILSLEQPIVDLSKEGVPVL